MNSIIHHSYRIQLAIEAALVAKEVGKGGRIYVASVSQGY